MARAFSTFAHTLGRLARTDRRCVVLSQPTSYIDVKVGKDGTRSFVLSIKGEQSAAAVPAGGNPRDIADQLVAVLCSKAGVKDPSELEMVDPAKGSAARAELVLTPVKGSAKGK